MAVKMTNESSNPTVNVELRRSKKDQKVYLRAINGSKKFRVALINDDGSITLTRGNQASGLKTNSAGVVQVTTAA